MVPRPRFLAMKPEIYTNAEAVAVAVAADAGTDARAMWREASRFSYLGIFFGVAIVLGYAAGQFLGRRFGHASLFMTLGILVGVAASFKELIQLSRRYQREQERL